MSGIEGTGETMWKKRPFTSMNSRRIPVRSSQVEDWASNRGRIWNIVRAPPGCRRPLFISRVWRLNLDNFLGFNSETWMGFTPMLAFNQLPRRGQGCGEALGSV